MSTSHSLPVKARLALILTCLLWAISFVASKVALQAFPPFTVVALRLLVSSVFLLGWLRLSGRSIPWKTHGKTLLLLSLFGTGLHYGVQTLGLTFTTAANAGVYAVTSPLTISLIAWLFLGESLGRRKMVGLGVALLGVLLVLGPQTLGGFQLQGRWLGDGLVFLSIVMWGIFTVLGKKATRELDPLVLSGGMTFLGTLMMLPVSGLELVLGKTAVLWGQGSAWLGVVFLGVGCSFLATLLYLYALERGESQKVGAYLYTIPPLTQLFAFLILGEQLGWCHLAGTGMVLLGVWQIERG